MTGVRSGSAAMTEPYRPLVMIADDHGDRRETYAGHLARAGYTVVECGEVTECREMARRFRPDLIVLELRVGGAGAALAEALRADPALAAVPLIAVIERPLDQDWGPAARFARTLARPCLPEVLAAAIAQVLPPARNISLAVGTSIRRW